MKVKKVFFSYVLNRLPPPLDQLRPLAQQLVQRVRVQVSDLRAGPLLGGRSLDAPQGHPHAGQVCLFPAVRPGRHQHPQIPLQDLLQGIGQNLQVLDFPFSFLL